MSDSTKHRYQHTLVVESIAEILLFDRVSTSVFGTDRYAPYLLVGLAIGIDYALRLPLLFAEPWRFSTSTAIVGGLIIGLVGALYMRNGYAEAIEQLRLDERPDEYNPDDFSQVIPFRLQVAFYVIFLLLIYYEVFVNLGFGTLVQAGGLFTEGFRHFVAYPVAYVPIIIDVGVMFVTIQFILPRRLRDADFELFFFDPRDMGGFAPIGQLLKRSYYVYTAGLLAYFAFSYIPVLISNYVQTPYEPSSLVAVFFTLAWIGGIISIAYSMWTVHRIMAGQKEAQLQELESQLREAIDQPYNIGESTLPDEESLRQLTRRIEEVRATKEYPTTFAMWSQILISVVLPQALNMVVQIGG